MQYIATNMLNYVSFVVDDDMVEADVTLQFGYCGGIVKEITPEATHCKCKLTVAFWLGCNDITSADSVALVVDDEVKQTLPITLITAEK